MPALIANIDFFASAPEVARQLIGVTLLVEGVGGRIVETEAYAPEDPASHSFSGITQRNAPMFGPPAHAYVYRSYGLHWCLNFVCGEVGHGAAVLIRALQPLEGVTQMQQRRGLESSRLLCAGPGRLCQALAISAAHNGMNLAALPFMLISPMTPQVVVAGARIGISRAVTTPWRFALENSPYLSRPLRQKK